MTRDRRPGLLVAALSLTTSASHGSVLYGFSVLVTREAAGMDFSTTILSLAFGGAILVGGAIAPIAGRVIGVRGARLALVVGGLLGFAGFAGFALAQEPWHVLAAWWLLVGPGALLTSYEPAYIVITQAFERRARVRAIGAMTLIGGLTGPAFVPATGWLVEAHGWRATAGVLGLLLGLAALVTSRLIPAVARAHSPSLRGQPRPRVSAHFFVFTISAGLAIGGAEALLVHRIAVFESHGFPLATVALWAAISGFLSVPGRYLLPAVTRRANATHVFSGVVLVLAAATALAARSGTPSQMIAHFALSGAVYGAVMPLRAVVMGDMYVGPSFGRLLGTQAAAIAIGRAATPAGMGLLRDTSGAYVLPVAALSLLLVVAALLALVSLRSAATAGEQRGSVAGE